MYNLSLMLRSFFQTSVARNASRVAVVDYDTGTSYTYGQLHDRSRRLAYYLKHECGLKKNDRVAVCARNGMWMLDAFYAMPYLGTILTTYNCMFKIQELLPLIVKETPSVFLYENIYHSLIAEIKKLFPNLTYICIDGPQYQEIVTTLPLASELPADLGTEDIAILLHTGGTTGIPKAAMMSYRSILSNTVAQIISYDFGEQDIVYLSFPFFHIAAWNIALPILQLGGKIILKRKFDAAANLDMIMQYGLTILAGSPSVFRRLTECDSFASVDFSSVKKVRCGAGAPSDDLMEVYLKKNLIFYNGYGMTEAGGGIMSIPAGAMTPQDIRRKKDSVGKLMLFSQARIVDEHDREVPPGTKGELLLQSVQMCSGYWNNKEETEKTFRDGWLYTGDIAYMDQEGYFYICGRKKNLFVSGGENIYPQEIENVLLNHPGVRDAVVFGVPDALWGEVGKAVVMPRDGCTLSEDALQAHLRQHLSTIKVPKYIQVVAEIPRSESGKVNIEHIKTIYGQL